MITIVLAALALSPLTAPAVPADRAAAPALRISRVADLAEGEEITVTGTGFRPGLKSVAVGLCREGYTNGLKDCDLGGGATFVNIDAHGAFPTVRLKARSKFNGIDCMTRQCVIGAAPLPTTNPPAIVNANTAIVRVGFKGSQFKGGATPAAAAPQAAAGPDTGGPSTPLWAATLGVLVLAGAAVAAAQRRSQHPRSTS
ncbi:Neocarzinostatin family protein [Thermomonospora echinospora]|uniref:Neocarzinostatin family protein n=1 Tax=Thermomonospora echinospora TaxID=1992 RepID=A0A1H6B1A4_9ACTN|nr:neocarzinostatin apoprotein domain-containing protein [Thermomonospora echinospora]SEG54631.1 Neocarzinostatin family protein [Thermomonospora echinospora]